MVFVMLAFWAIVVTAVVIAVRSGRSGPGDVQAAASDPERILAERFARGEIDADEYTRRRDLLRSR
jgi:Predicted membrane protein